ncbi:MAG TPA: aminotransferase class IV family protein [Rhodanobacteraceae bacterium]|nr:aminotransferase class IV family protein [Rhodanobacteraceae bacterium]
MTAIAIPGSELPQGAVPDRVELNGRAATADDLRCLALMNYGHFTSLRVEDGAVRGLDLHLDRLDKATRALLGVPLDPEFVRTRMRGALRGDAGTCAMRVTVFSKELRRDLPSASAAPDVLVSLSAARSGPSAPLRLKTFRYERAFPEIKHVATFPLYYHRRLAQLAGFDDAVFVSNAGCISEASIWNLGFLEGDTVVWPEAPMLDGVSMQLIRSGSRERGIATTTRRIAPDDLGRYHFAFLTNASCAVQPVASIDDVRFDANSAAIARLAACHDDHPPQAI